MRVDTQNYITIYFVSKFVTIYCLHFLWKFQKYTYAMLRYFWATEHLISPACLVLIITVIWQGGRGGGPFRFERSILLTCNRYIREVIIGIMMTAAMNILWYITSHANNDWRFIIARCWYKWAYYTEIHTQIIDCSICREYKI